MKKKLVKNRKRELRNKRLVYGAIFFGLTLVIGSVIFVLFSLLYPYTYISPITSTPQPATEKKSSASTNDMIMQEVQKQLSQENISYTTVRLIDPTTYQIQLNDNGEVLIATTKNISQQIASLQLITSRLTMEGKRFSRLDLRYDQPILSE